MFTRDCRHFKQLFHELCYPLLLWLFTHRFRGAQIVDWTAFFFKMAAIPMDCWQWTWRTLARLHAFNILCHTYSCTLKGRKTSKEDSKSPMRCVWTGLPCLNDSEASAINPGRKFASENIDWSTKLNVASLRRVQFGLRTNTNLEGGEFRRIYTWNG